MACLECGGGRPPACLPNIFGEPFYGVKPVHLDHMLAVGGLSAFRLCQCLPRTFSMVRGASSMACLECGGGRPPVFLPSVFGKPFYGVEPVHQDHMFAVGGLSAFRLCRRWPRTFWIVKSQVGSSQPVFELSVVRCEAHRASCIAAGKSCCNCTLSGGHSLSTGLEFSFSRELPPTSWSHSV